VSAFLDVVENSLGQPSAKYRDAMPLYLGDPLVFGIFPTFLPHFSGAPKSEGFCAEKD
jgi:hypothetical protein